SMIILLLVLFMHIYFKISVSKVGTFLYIVFYIFIFAVLSTYIFYVSNESKENKNVRLIAEKLANEQDPLAEFLFHDIEENMKYDEVLEEYYKNIPLFEKNIVKRLQQKYFKSFLSKYDVQFTFCKENDTIKFKPVNAQRIKKINKPHIVKNQLVRKICDVYFEEQIKKYGRPTMSSNLYFLNNGGDISYLAKIPITTDEDSPETIMYIELEAKGMVRELGYPELLIDKDVNLNPDLSNYSYARYRNNVLINTFGNYIYSNNGINYNKSPEKVIFFNMGGYNHMYYKVDKTDFLIISKKQLGFVDIISPFTYLFVIFLIFTLLLQVFAKIPLKLFLIEYNFRTKIQSSMIIIVLISLLMIGSTTIYYIIKLNNSKNSDSIEEKTHSVLTEIENKFSASENLNTYTYDNLNDILINFSNIFFTDINIYNTNGDLIGSSREKIFDEGLIGKRMNLTAYKKMFFEQQPYFVHDEYIGKLGYSSAYVPFRNNQNKTIAFLNIPYFTQQSELKREISVYLVTIINIYLLLTLIAVFVAIFISGRVAKPLSLIAEKLSQIKLGKKNELIKWSYNDEIGVLVKEYNRLTEELVRSADLLAKSERESAWREMARQVAHEIKNPLTPMKLGIQYIQKASNEDDPLLKERIEKFTKTMISQIDSLSSIASAFSDFANMPKSINELIELNNFINSVIDLHKDNESFDLTYSSDINSSCMIYADKKQLLRVFNNLINNSIQAFKDYVRGNIQIKLYSDDKFYYISFKDNGCGIDDSFKSKIFSPNFTTKNGGMGLGLAMCKSIINSFEGDISFVSTKDIGTTFFIKLPKISE
ncbi:MAG: HAMP domain-containing sensor histidine kinase, partial [Bacteroidota bacterium]|nr:HAMP domain-containing sensor histidine kinase [Bacteroidota bacterium]